MDFYLTTSASTSVYLQLSHGRTKQGVGWGCDTPFLCVPRWQNIKLFRLEIIDKFINKVDR